MNIQTIEERLQKKAEKIGKDRTQVALSGMLNPSDMQRALKDIKDNFSQDSTADILRRKLITDFWVAQDVITKAVNHYHIAKALEELRTELLEMSDRLEELTH